MRRGTRFYTGYVILDVVRFIWLTLRFAACAQVLITASELATYANDTALALAWAQNATALKQVFNDVFWLEDVGMYRDNATTTLCPEDANSFAVVFNLTQSEAQKAEVSDGLTKNWNDIGPVVPELPDTISPFIAGYEVRFGFLCGVLCTDEYWDRVGAGALRGGERCAGAGAYTEDVGLHAHYEPIRAEHALGRFHCEWLPCVRPFSIIFGL